MFLKKADPLYFQEGAVDVLISADLFWPLLCNGQVRLDRNAPTMHKTKLGLILAGELHSASKNHNKLSICNLSIRNLKGAVVQFW